MLGGSVLYEECYTDANPGPHIFLLYFNGNLIRNSSSGEFNVTVDSDGVYTCAPINTVGSGDNASFSVTIFGKNPSASLRSFLNVFRNYTIDRGIIAKPLTRILSELFIRGR